MRLATRIGLVIGALILVLAIALGVVLSNQARLRLIRLSEFNLQALSEEVSRELSAGLDGFARTIATQSDRDVFRSPVANHAEMRAALDNFQRVNPEFAFVAVIDAKSAVVLAATGGVFEGGNLRDRPVYYQGIKGPYLGDVHEAVRLAELLPKPTNGEPLRFLDVATPIYDSQGQVVRVLGAHVGWEWSRQLVQSVLGPIKTSERTEIFLVDTAGKAVLSDTLSVPVGTDLTAVIYTSPAHPSVQRVIWPDHQAYLTYSLPTLPQGSFPGFGWRVVARQPYDMVLAPVRDLQLGFLAGSVTLGLIAAFLAWGVAARLVRPIRLLADAADRAGVDDTFDAHGFGAASGEVSSVQRALSRFAHAAREGEHASLVSGQQFTLLAQSLPEVVWQASAEGALQYVSKDWLVPRDAHGKFLVGDLSFLLVEEDRLRFVQLWLHCLGEVKDMNLRCRLFTPEAESPRWSDFKARPVLGHSTTPIGWVGTIIDVHDIVTREQQAERLLAEERRARIDAERLARSRDEFLAVASHELRSPLSAISGWSDILAKHSSADPTVTKAAAVIRRNAQIQTALINDLLDMSAIMAGKIALKPELLNVGQMLAEVTAAQQEAATEKGLVLVGPPQQPLLINADRRRIMQVFASLIGNAVKFTPSGGRVEINLVPSGDEALITVSDTGQGIAREFLPHVFDRLRQEDASSTRRAGGLGLGLAIAQGIVELHRGSISVVSPGKGMGATFSVRLPWVRAEAPQARAKPAERGQELAEYSLPGMRILVVDDESDAREVAEASLVCLGARVTVASSGAEALQALEHGQFDLLVTDIGMPDMDGLTLVREVRKHPGWGPRQLPALALTAFAMESDRLRGLEAGLQAYVAKPISLQSLFDGIRTALHATA